MSSSIVKRKPKRPSSRGVSMPRRAKVYLGAAMSGSELRGALERLELDQYEAAALFRRSQAAFSQWTSGSRAVPPELAILVRLLLARKITRADIEAVMR
jgi:hypothetical protein